MATFRVQLDTALDATATEADLVVVFSTIGAAGGSDISVLRSAERERPRTGFSLEAGDRDEAAEAVASLLPALAGAAPSISGGWSVVSIREI